MPSGKQILLSLLQEYSQKKTSENQIQKISERLKSSLLLHGSSAHHMWGKVEQLSWLQQRPDIEQGDNDVKKQGLGLSTSQLLLSDLFSLITEEKNIPKNIKEIYPEITQDAYQAGVHTIWSLLKALEWSDAYEEVENGRKLDVEEKERLLKIYESKLEEYRNDPEDYS